MRIAKLLIAAILLSSYAIIVGTQTFAQRPRRLAITHVTIVDPSAAAPLFDRSVIISGDRITAIGPSGDIRIPRGARVVNGRGKFLIPGLWDMHVHLSLNTPNAFQLLIANGITGVRDMGGDLEALREWRGQTNRGRILGPQIVTGGRILDGPRGGDYARIVVKTPEEGRKAVRDLKERGVDFIKVHEALPPEAFLAVADEARKAEVSVVGHVPAGLRASTASKAGMKSIEHLTGILQESVADPAALERGLAGILASFDPERARSLNSVFVTNGTWQTPTLIIYRNQALGFNTQSPLLRFVPASRLARWREWFPSEPRTPESVAAPHPLYDKLLEIVRGMNGDGVRILAGSDDGTAQVSGFALHDELEELVRAGLSPQQALQAATSAPAEFLGISGDVGAIAMGKRADLVLLDADPLKDISHTRQIVAVIVRGRYVNEAARKRLLAQAEALAK